MSRTIEITSSGYDEYLQSLGGDPFGGSSSMGLRVPKLATPNRRSRYLFLGASFSLGPGDRARIVGWRQFASLGFVLTAAGVNTPGRFIERPIESTNFRLPDGNISWHLQSLGSPNSNSFPHFAPTPLDLQSFKKGWADAGCLLYSSYTIPAGNKIYTQLTSYVPPMGGKPWGQNLSAGHHGTFYDMRVPWRDAHAWTSLDVDVRGPDTIAAFISVRQSAGVYGVASSPLAFLNGLGPEEQFIGSFGDGSQVHRPIYWRVGVSLVVELEK